MLRTLAWAQSKSANQLSILLEDRLTDRPTTGSQPASDPGGHFSSGATLAL